MEASAVPKILNSDIEGNVNAVQATVKTIAKVVNGISNRAARFYWNSEKPLVSSSHEASHSSGLQIENPLVAATIAAGVVGVSIIAVIILTIWIRSKMPPTKVTNLQKNHSVVSSFSTLFEMEVFEDTPKNLPSDNPA